MRNGCVSCHTIAGTSAMGRFSPDLTHVASRDTIASGAVPNTPENLKKWIDDPDHMKPGSLMPAMHLNDRDLDTLTAYLSHSINMADSIPVPEPSISRQRRQRTACGWRRCTTGSPPSITRRSVSCTSVTRWCFSSSPAWKRC